MTLLSPSNGWNEEVYSFTSDGQVVRGVVHQPKSPVHKGLILLPAGYKYRVGPHDFYVRMARELAVAGITVLRVDYPGLGFSDGDPPTGPVYAGWQRVEDGFFGRITAEIARDFRDRFQLEVVMAGGICGGAITALIAAARAPDVIRSIVGINIPVTRTKSPGRKKNTVTSIKAVQRGRKDHLRKLVSLAAWRRLLTGTSSYKSMIRLWLPHFFKVDEAKADSLVNPAFLDAWQTTEKQKVLKLLAFGGKDNRWYEFNDLFLSPSLSGRKEGDSYSVAVIEDANHEIFFPEWQQDCISVIRSFLMKDE